MNLLTISTGFVCIAYGLYTFYARARWPKQLHKLQPMKALWGKKTGTLIHTVGYSVLPIIAGIAFVWTGLHGGSLLD